MACRQTIKDNERRLQPDRLMHDGSSRVWVLGVAGHAFAASAALLNRFLICSTCAVCHLVKSSAIPSVVEFVPVGAGIAAAIAQIILIAQTVFVGATIGVYS